MNQEEILIRLEAIVPGAISQANRVAAETGIEDPESLYPYKFGLVAGDIRALVNDIRQAKTERER